MGKGFLIDTNTGIDLAAEKMPDAGQAFVIKIVDDKFHLSVINKIEMLGFPNVPKGLQNLVSGAIILQLTDEITERTISIRKIHRIKLPDAIIAATALVHELVVITRNTRDFERIEGVEVIDPYSVA